MSTGLVYDEKMCLHEDKEDHPENPDRIKHIFNKIKESSFAGPQGSGLLEKCTMVDVREATDEEILMVHTKKHLDDIKSIPELNCFGLEKLANGYNSIYLNKFSELCARLSAGGAIELCDNILSGKIKNGIAVIRPPGHHAESDKCMGFCIFNNVAIVAKNMIKKYDLTKVAIIDWDVHHGNATQHTFEDDDSVLYISIHRYDRGTFYPSNFDADPYKIGIGKGIGKNVNIAWNTTPNSKIADNEYIHAYEKVIQPMLLEYDPELIIISAGFDCAKGDPLGGLHVTPKCFGYLTSQLMNFANGKILLALEGGYNIDAISESMLECLKALLGEPYLLFSDNSDNSNNSDKFVSHVALSAVKETLDAHKKYWKFLN